MQLASKPKKINKNIPNTRPEDATTKGRPSKPAPMVACVRERGRWDKDSEFLFHSLPFSLSWHTISECEGSTGPTSSFPISKISLLFADQWPLILHSAHPSLETQEGTKGIFCYVTSYFLYALLYETASEISAHFSILDLSCLAFSYSFNCI